MRRLARPLVSLGVMAMLAVALVPACSLGEGQGQVSGVLDAPDCWYGPFNLNPDFFAAVPYGQTLTIRIQKGSDFQTFSDGLSILVDNIQMIRGTGNDDGLLGTALDVSLPPGVTPPGVPITPNPNPAIVHATLYLGKSCRTQDVALYALDTVSLHADGTCSPPADGGTITAPTCGANGGVAGGTDGGSTPATDASTPADASDGAASASDGGPSAAAGTAVGKSSITFFHLFDGDPNETDASERYTQANFDFFLADPREICPGGLGPPPPCRGEISGYFQFYFERGQPAQPFP